VADEALREDVLETGETIYAFRTEGVIKIIRKLDAASQMARALERCLPALLGLADRRDAEEDAVRALATWEEACRTQVRSPVIPTDC
jgi:hypothetical protein